MKQIFFSGGTGYLGRALAPKLIGRGHAVRMLVRPGSEGKLPAGVTPVVGDVLEHATFQGALNAGDTFVHLVGVPHPAPWKGAQFRAIDLVSLRQSAVAAKAAGVGHFVYVSVAHPAPIMREYIAVRTECERTLAEAGLTRTILRPWYVLGPGHRWPAAIAPVYALMERIGATREGARRLGLVTLEQMVEAMVWAIEHPPGVAEARVMGVPEIRMGRVSAREFQSKTPVI